MLLAAITLVPTGRQRTALRPDTLRDLLMSMRVAEDRVEHIKVVELVGLLWIGAYISVADPKIAQENLNRLCDRLIEVIEGWELVRDPQR